MNKYNIAIFGAFDHENFGDLLFPYVFENQIKKRIEDVRIELFSFAGGAQPFNENKHINKITDFREKNKELEFDLIAIGGGDLVRLDENVNDFYDIGMKTTISMWLLPIVYGKIYNIPVVFNAPGIPYYFSLAQERSSASLLNTLEYISVRDEQSKYKLLSKFLTKQITVVPDTVLSISEFLTKENMDSDIQKLRENLNLGTSEYVLFQVYNMPGVDNYISEIASALAQIKKEHDCKIIFMPIGYVHDDIGMMRKIYDLSKDDFQIIEKKLKPFELVALIANSKAFFGTSLHGSVIATSYGVPAFALSFDLRDKMRGFFQLINKEDRILINGSGLYESFKKNTDVPLLKKNLLKIEEHFDEIASIAISENDSSEDIDDFLVEVILNGLQEPLDSSEKGLSECKLIFNFGNKYIEEKSRFLKVNREGVKHFFKISGLQNVEEFKIRFLGNCLYEVSNISIFPESANIDFTIPNSFSHNDKIYMLNREPDVFIYTKQSVEEIEVTMDITIVSERVMLENHKEMLEYYSELNSIELNNIINSKSWKLTKNLRVLKNRVSRKK